MSDTWSESMAFRLAFSGSQLGVRTAWLTGLGTLAIAMRMPWVSRVLHNHDAVNYALALNEYDVSKFQPHAPGVPLYVVFAKLVTLLVQNTNLALVAVSILGSLLAAVVAFLFAERWFGTVAAVVFALGLSTSPLFWFFGEVASPYTVGVAISLIIAAGCYDILQGGRPLSFYGTALLLGLSGGIRPDIPLFLTPLWLFTSVRGLRRPRAIPVGFLLIALGTLAWLLPTIWLSGGPASYLSATQRQASLFTPFSFRTTAENSLLLLAWTLWGLGSGCAVLGYLIVTQKGRSALVHAFRDRSVAPFFFLWTLPPLAFFSLTHIGINEGGYALAFIPPLCLLSGRILAIYLGWHHPRSVTNAAVLGGLCLAIVLTNGVLFLLPAPVPEEPTLSSGNELPGPGGYMNRGLLWITRGRLDITSYVNRGFLRMTAWAIARNDQYRSFYLASIGRVFSPYDTMIIANGWYRHIMYYLPDFLVANGHIRPQECLVSRHHVLRSHSEGQPVVVPSDVRRIVWLIGPVDLSLSEPPPLQRKAAADGSIAWEEVDPGTIVRHGACTLNIPLQAGQESAGAGADRLSSVGGTDVVTRPVLWSANKQ